MPPHPVFIPAWPGSILRMHSSETANAIMTRATPPPMSIISNIDLKCRSWLFDPGVLARVHHHGLCNQADSGFRNRHLVTREEQDRRGESNPSVAILGSHFCFKNE